MFPPPQTSSIDLAALSEICGSISIACWVVVFSPQIIENFRRSSAEGLSIVFLVIWLLGDIFNILGAILQGLREHLSHLDPAHLSPATPLHDPPKRLSDPAAGPGSSRLPSRLQAAVSNAVAILIVCAAGVFGWWLSARVQHGKSDSGHHTEQQPEPLEFDFWGQVFGYLCAILYLGSRIPQLLLNYRRKSTEGVSLLFFLFACIGNLTFDMSIFAYDPTPLCEGRGVGKCVSGEASQIYAKYIAVNASWIAGSLGTLLLDMCIFIQFFLYRSEDACV
ncbi:hypothetical protein DV737_g3656, partial [Chaetothyriales sp. CBS 132003]